MIALFIFLTIWIGLLWTNNIPIYLLLVIGLLFILHKRLKSKRVLLTFISIFFLAQPILLLRTIFDRSNNTQFNGFVFDSRENYFILSSKLNKYYVSNYDNQYDVGDYLLITGKKEKIDFSTLESDFDFNEYLGKKGIKYSILVEKIKVGFSNPIRITTYREWFLSRFDNHSRNLIDSILFGRDDGLDSTNTVIKELHLYRLIASCGIYFTLIAKFIEAVLFRNKHRKYSRLVSIGLLTFLSILSFPKLAPIRVVGLLLLKWLNNYVFKKKFSYIGLLSFLGICLLVIDPYLAGQDSFILGFGFLLFIFLISRYISEFRGYKKRIIQVVFLYLFFLPFEILYNHSVMPLSIIAGFILSPLFIPLTIMGFVGLFGVPIYPFANKYGDFINWSVNLFKGINLEIYARPLSGWETLLYYLIFHVFIYYLSIHFRQLYKTIRLILLSSCVFNFLPISNYLSSEVSFINVGQGDSCFIRHNQTTILIDTGGLSNIDVAKRCLIPFFKKRRVYKIDLLITTHNDFDHMGAKDSLIENFRVKRFFDNSNYFPLTIGGIHLTNYNIYSENSDDDNEKSLVIGFTLMNKSFLVTGDADKGIERKIIKDHPDLRVDILKAGHHGSNTSSDEEFIKTIDPDEAVISCGKNNKYGHPHKEVLSILNKYHIKIRRTDYEGTITYKSFNFI